MPVASRLSSVATFSRWRGESVRIVPSNEADSGMMLSVVPARIRPIVTTAGSNTETLRVTMAWIAVTISHAIGTGSSASCGIEACPPLPEIVMCSLSAEARSGPARPVKMPCGALGMM